MGIEKRLAKLEVRMKSIRSEPGCAVCGYPATAIEPFVVDSDLGEPCEQCGREKRRDGRPFIDWRPLIIVEGDGCGDGVGDGMAG